MKIGTLACGLLLAGLSGCALHQGQVLETAGAADLVFDTGERRWLAGDHHIHSEFSAKYVDSTNPGQPPTPVFGGDGRYSITDNALKAREHGLAWMVSTDHGGPNHSKINHDDAWPALQQARREVPEVVQFFGMEFDTPGGDHSSLIMPHSHDERSHLHTIESRWSQRDAWPRDPARDAEPKMLEALEHMRQLEAPPVLIANHPSRSATDVGVYGKYAPAEFRAWNDTAPQVAVGMEGAPGHQAAAIAPDGGIDPEGARGGYKNAPTMGGFDQMTARLGGFWDSMLGEGRRWWVTSTSDAHRHWREGGSDFYPGEYSKTYVLAEHGHDDILDGIRNGRVFVTTGDLISELDVVVRSSTEPDTRAGIGGSLHAHSGSDVEVAIRVRDPAGTNYGGHSPEVARIDLIIGEVTGPAVDRSNDSNPTTRVVRRFTATDWVRDGEYLTMTHTLPAIATPGYLRVRGTSTTDLEPAADPRGEDPWTDLWFYSNPVFIDVH
ncbi:hypothetical protein ACW7G0_05725 [Lysobacter sp. A286]